MTQTITLWPIIKALLQAALFLSNYGKTPPENWYTQWQTNNETQHHFVQKYLPEYKDITKFKSDELKGWASKNYQELNDILKKEHFAIQLEPFPQDGFGVVAILDVMLEWLSPGTSKKLVAKNSDIAYASVQIERGFTVFNTSNHAYPLVRLETKSGDMVWFTIADKPRNIFDLLDFIHTIKNNIQQDDQYQGVMFPKIDLDQQPDITWLLKMSYAGYFIAQAKQQTKFKMNEFGAHVKSAAAIAMMRSAPPSNKKILIIDQPFFCWIEKPNVSLPIFAGYLDTDVWKDPGTLDMESTAHQRTDTSTPQEESSWWSHVKSLCNVWWSKVVGYFS